jgi:hypothetical protein
VVGIHLLLKHERKESEKEQARFSQAISIPLLSDDLKKIITVIGERNVSSETAQTNLSRTASMIEGLLGPSNTGYAIKKHRGPANWPLLQATIRGKSEESPVWIVTSYDSRAGSRGAEANGSGLAATLAVAQALASEKPENSIHFLFLPHANDLESPVLDSAMIFRDLTKANPPKAILAIEAMGSGETLWMTSRDTTAFPLQKIDGLGKIIGAEVACLGEDTDLASVLSQLDLPAVRIATRAIVTEEESDDREPFPPTVAASAGRLVELIRRVAAK